MIFGISRMQAVLMLLCLGPSLSLGAGDEIPVEEYFITGPNQLQSVATQAYLEERKKDPENFSLNNTSPIMVRAHRHAVKRLAAKDEKDLNIRKVGAEHLYLANQFQLPAPAFADEMGSEQLASAVVSTSGSSYEVSVSPESVSSLAVAFFEDVSLGAISKAGALPMGIDGEWVKFAEDKLKRDAQLNYQELMWELGSEVVEKAFVDGGGMNETHERALLAQLTDWFERGGGSLRFVRPNVSREHGFQLIATEDVDGSETVVKVPVKLTMCRVTARNVLITGKGKYLGAELKATFEKNEAWGLALFLLHEYFKETEGQGSKWGPYLRMLRVRFLTTPALRSLEGSTAAEVSRKWVKEADKLNYWSTGHDGPCNPTTYVCRSKPNDKLSENRFSLHQIRWAYWVVRQNAVRVRHETTGNAFLALVPFYDMMEKRLNGGGGISFEVDGSVGIRLGESAADGTAAGLHPGDLTDAEFFMRYLRVPHVPNPNNAIVMSLPGPLPSDSQFLACLKDPKQARRKDECKGGQFRSHSVFWQSETLAKWRREMNLPPRLGELQMWASRLHIFGDDQEEQKRISNANAMLAGLPVSTDVMSAEEQLMLLGLAQDNDEASLMISGKRERIAPQLYSAPDPGEDPEAQKAMENLATLALQIQNVITSGNIGLNATRIVINQTREFFQHGIMPQPGLDALDDFLLKKIGMILHCGYSNNMKIRHHNISEELFCAMRVHLMNETEVHTFCPADARIWNDNCQDVEFMNFTAISFENEMSVVKAFRGSVGGLLGAYPTTLEEDRVMQDDESLGAIMREAVKLRVREKEMIVSSLVFLDEYEQAVVNGSVPFQLLLKMKEREESDRREEAHRRFVAEVRARAAEKLPVAQVEVDLGEGLKANLTLVEGEDLQAVARAFCVAQNVPLSNVPNLVSALRGRVVSPTPLLLTLGVVVPTGDRRVLGIPEGSNATLETHVFCARNNITKTHDCDALHDRVQQRLENLSFARRILLVLPIDAPDGRKLRLVVREGEQHDLPQFVSDFFELYRMPQESVSIVINEVLKRLPPAALQIPVGLGGKRKVAARFAESENVTAVTEGFCNFFEIDESTKLQIIKMARAGMAPGTFVV